MIDILDYAHQYVPSTEDGKVLERIFFGGDQLTVERATHAQDARLQSKEELKNCGESYPSQKIGMQEYCFSRLVDDN